MHDPNAAMLAAAATVLQPLLDELVFVGGCTTGLMITDEAAAPVRATRDVDAVAEVVSYVEYGSLSERLRELGLKEDTSEDAPLCRWRHGNLIIDVMPIDARALGFANRWYEQARATSRELIIRGLRLRVVTPVYFLATKLEAFRGRGQGDFAGSRDVEDVIAVVDGRPEIVDEVAHAVADVRAFIANEFGGFLVSAAFLDAVPGLLLPDQASQERLPVVLERLRLLSLAAS